jgi:hypothetical protein
MREFSIFYLIDRILHRFLWALTEAFPGRTREIRVDGKKYLRRFYITPRRLDEQGETTGHYKGFGIYLHYFYRGDEDRELHNHPWKNAFSFILTGGYQEERKAHVHEAVINRLIRRYTFNNIKHNTFHRVTKRPGANHIWTIFFTGKRVQDWGFWDKDANTYIPHGDFVNYRDQGYKTKD